MLLRVAQFDAVRQWRGEGGCGAAGGTFLALTLMVSTSGKCGIIRKCGPALVTGVHSVTVSQGIFTIFTSLLNSNLDSGGCP